MILSRRVALDGVQLDELDERIVIRSIDPGVPKEALSVTDRMGGAGQRMTMQHWQALEIAVSFAIDVYKRDLETRKQIFDMVNAWALKKGWLTVNYIPGRRVYVDKVVVPGSGDLWDWTREYQIIFRAYGVPFWQDEEPVTAEKKTVSTGSVQIAVNGTAESVLNIYFKNVSGKTIPDFSVSAGGCTLALTGVNIGVNETLAITHEGDGTLKAKCGTRNVYGLMTGSDDLYVKPGVNTVTVNAGRAGNLTVENFGRYV